MATLVVRLRSALCFSSAAAQGHPGRGETQEHYSTRSHRVERTQTHLISPTEQILLDTAWKENNGKGHLISAKMLRILLTLFPGKGTMNNSSSILLASSTVAHHLYCFLNPFRITSAVCLNQPGCCIKDHNIACYQQPGCVVITTYSNGEW